MNYQQTIDYLNTTLPMYQRIGAAAYKEDLTNTIALCAALGNPQDKFLSVHVAGTNGKGSSSHMLAAILQSAGYKTGLYTSPHLKDFNERIRINGEPVTQEFVVRFVDRIQKELETIRPSFFETTVAMAFEYFAEHHVDIAIIEVGLGGRLDSTNVITPLVSLITNISWDHMNLLGNTLQKIAAEKAGIIKKKVAVVISQHQPETDRVFVDKAAASEAPIVFGEDLYEITEQDKPGVFDVFRDGTIIFHNLVCGLKGSYQRKNMPGVLATVDQLRTAGWEIPVMSVVLGIARIVPLTGLKGRWQKLNKHPLTFCDIAHNEDGIREIIRNIARIPHRKLHLIIGMVNDKDISSVLALLPKDAFYYFCQANIPRAMDAAELAQKAGGVGEFSMVIADVNEAIRTATSKAATDDLIVITGSAFVVAEIDNL